MLSTALHPNSSIVGSVASRRVYGDTSGFKQEEKKKVTEQDEEKAFEELVESANLGSRDACFVLWQYYDEESDVERDINLAKYWCQLAAVRGCSASRTRLAKFDLKARDQESAVRHLMISCRQGNDDGLKLLGRLYREGLKRKDPCVTKDQYAEALRSHKKFADSMKSDSREAAVAFGRGAKSFFNSDVSFFLTAQMPSTQETMIRSLFMFTYLSCSERNGMEVFDQISFKGFI